MGSKEMSRETDFKEIMDSHAKNVVREICNQIELVGKRDDLTSPQKLSLLKDLNKSLIYRENRTLFSHLKIFFQGLKVLNYKIYSPE